MNENVNTRPLLIADYDYRLPDERIAKYPLRERDSSKLLIYKNGEIASSVFSQIADLLPKQSLLVCNNTRVIHARIIFHKSTGARIEIFCLEPVSPNDYVLSLSATESCEWLCLIGNLKKWKEGILERVVSIADKTIRFSAERTLTQGNTYRIRFRWDNPQITFSDILEQIGELPIPPYLNRAPESSDKETYQTVYSKIEGSVAAPTAGLHFTEHVFDRLQKKQITVEELTLHVGAGTFQPVKSNDVTEHVMHTETIAVRLSTIRRIKQNRGHVVAVGTTSVRTLESLYYIGRDLHFAPATETAREGVMRVEQWVPYRSNRMELSVDEALQNIIDYLEKNRLDTLHAETQILIKPGFRFRLVDGIITNFHQPRSTLLLLVSAFVGEDWRRIYEFALNNDFRFLSYGDSSLLWPKPSMQ